MSALSKPEGHELLWQVVRTGEAFQQSCLPRVELHAYVSVCCCSCCSLRSSGVSSQANRAMSTVARHSKFVSLSAVRNLQRRPLITAVLLRHSSAWLTPQQPHGATPSRCSRSCTLLAACCPSDCFVDEMQVLHEDEINSSQRCKAGYGQLADSSLRAAIIRNCGCQSGELVFVEADATLTRLAADI